MPQLDQFTYFTQFFWLCLFLFSLHLLFRFCPFDLQIHFFFFLVTKPKLQGFLSIMKWFIFVFIALRVGLALYPLFSSLLSDSLWLGVLPSDADNASNKPDLALRLGPPGTPLERGESSLPSLNGLSAILYEQQVRVPGKNLVNVALGQSEMTSIVERLPKEELQEIIGEDSLGRALQEFNARQQSELKNMAIRHFEFKNAIIAKMKSLYPEDEWDFTTIIREKFFMGRQRGREYSLEELQRMLSALNMQGKSSSCAQRLRFNLLNWNWKEQ